MYARRQKSTARLAAFTPSVVQIGAVPDWFGL